MLKKLLIRQWISGSYFDVCLYMSLKNTKWLKSVEKMHRTSRANKWMSNKLQKSWKICAFFKYSSTENIRAQPQKKFFAAAKNLTQYLTLCLTAKKSRNLYERKREPKKKRKKHFHFIWNHLSTGCYLTFVYFVVFCFPIFLFFFFRFDLCIFYEFICVCVYVQKENLT